MSQRINQLRQLLVEKKVDGILITSPQNRFYLSGFTGSTATLLITAKRLILMTDSRYTLQCKTECPEFEIVDVKGKYIAYLNDNLTNLGVKLLGFESDDVTYDWFLDYSKSLVGITLQPFDLSKIRVLKDADEVAIMKEAAAIAEKALARTIAQTKPGMTEKEVDILLVSEMRRLGATKESFDSIIASGHRGALPHGHASDKKLQKGEFVTFDFGAYYKGYCSDITRTFVLGKPAENKLVEIYEIVREAQQRALEAVRPGIACSAIDKVARDYITEKGYGPQFGHSTGHGLGALIHEFPSVSGKSETILQPGMVITIEPGIYIDGLGGVRIEDDVLVTATGYEVLNHFDKKLKSI